MSRGGGELVVGRGGGEGAAAGRGPVRRVRGAFISSGDVERRHPEDVLASCFGVVS